MRSSQLAEQCAVLLDRHASATEQPTAAVQYVDLVLLHQETHAIREPLGDGARTRNDFLEVEAHVGGTEAVCLQVVQQVVDLRRMQQCLGRNTSPVEADAAEMLALDQRRAQSELAGTNGGNIA